MLLRSLPPALLSACLSAQSPTLVYDNGPFATAPGVSILQNTALGHSVLGFGAQLVVPTIDNSCLDEFVVANAMTIEQVEFYCYQTNAPASPSTITGAFLAFYDQDPSLIGTLPMAGSTAPMFDLFSTPNNPVANAWTGIYRAAETTPADTSRPVMAVRLRLEDAAGVATPLVLTPGTYWIEIQTTGSLPSGPFVPPITCRNQRVTGNAMQRLGATNTFNNPLVSGVMDGQGIPFKLFGPPIAAAGSITVVATNNHGLTLTVCGAPNLGGFIRTELGGVQPGGLPVIGFDFGITATTFCGSNFVHAFPLSVLLATAAVVQLPAGPSFGGFVFGIQGAELTPSPATPGACIGGANISDGYRVQINM